MVDNPELHMQNSLLVVQNFKIGRNIGNIAKQKYGLFLSTDFVLFSFWRITLLSIRGKASVIHVYVPYVSNLSNRQNSNPSRHVITIHGLKSWQEESVFSIWTGLSGAQ